MRRRTDRLFFALCMSTAVIWAAFLIWFIYHVNAPLSHADEWKWQSWDQENLKKGDSGCPTSIYVAPNGVLEQC